MVGKHGICLPAIVIDGGHFNILLGVNWIKKSKAKLDFNLDQINIKGEMIP